MLDIFADPHCMSCKRGFLRDHLVQVVPKAFVSNEYKRHRENILFEREKCMFPATQARMEIDNERKLVNDQIRDHRKARNGLIREWNSLKYRRQLDPSGLILVPLTLEDQQNLKSIMDKILQEGREINALVRERYRLMYAHLGEEQREDKEKRRFVRKCPGEDCQGFLSTQWKCGLCETKVCNKCLEVKKDSGGEGGDEPSHVCDPEILKSAQLIADDTKPCPSCGTRIFKISGCSQMWCPSCHTAFDWRTLRIVTGLIHNPHYYEYQRSVNGGGAPHNPGDVPGCEQIPNYWRCKKVWETLEAPPIVHTKLADMHRMFIHIQNYEIPLLPNAQYNAEDNEDIRRRFMRKEIDETRFKWFLQKREKKTNKSREIRQLLEMFVACGSDIVRRCVQEDLNQADIMNAFDDLRGLCAYLDESAEKINSTYGGVVPHIRFVPDEQVTNKGERVAWCSKVMVNL
jgi:hypothetical protein